jgi:limonene 1,2-monooxygenase
VSHEWATGKRNELFGRAGQAMLNAITAHVDEKADETAGTGGGPR